MTRANPLLRILPHFLTWRAFGFRTICSGRLGFDGVKQLGNNFTEKFEIGSRLITFQIHDKIAPLQRGTVVLDMEGNKVLSTVSAKDAVCDFLPLKIYYQGLISMRRTRLIDRAIRPLFPSEFYHDVQIMVSGLISDGKQDSDVLAANATSAALMLSDIPWGGPMGMVRIGRICGEFIVNPTMNELKESDFNLVYACTKDKTLMIDVQAREISEKDLEAGLRFAHTEAVKYLEPQIRLAAKAGKSKKEYKLSIVSDTIVEKVRNVAEASIEALFPLEWQCEEAYHSITHAVKTVLEKEGDEESLKVLTKALHIVKKKMVRKRVMAEGYRVDGRQLDELRPLVCEAGSLSTTSLSRSSFLGSASLSHGDTEVSCSVTRCAPTRIKRFMLRSSPPFCINERTLVEKALFAVLPEDDFSYTVDVYYDDWSNSSKSMATVCRGSLALMGAGIPLREHVAGVSMGLVSEFDPSGEITDYRILSDILDEEYHLGDIHFKIAGTRKGVTAIQLDIKPAGIPAGIPLDIICECLEPAHKARLQILDRMEQAIAPQFRRIFKSMVVNQTPCYNSSYHMGPLGILT